MTEHVTLVPLTRFEWEKTVRVVVMPPTAKLVAFALATYANKGGDGVRPGRRRLAAELGVSPRTVERQLAWLQHAGLLQKVFDGQSQGRRGMASVYRLVLAEDLPDRVAFVSLDTSDETYGEGQQPTVDDGQQEPSSLATVVPAELSTPVTDDPAELPTPVTGTTDSSDRTLVTGVADLSSPMSTHQNNDQNNYHQGKAPTRPLREAVATLPVDDATYNFQLT